MAFQPFGYAVKLTVQLSREQLRQCLKANIPPPGGTNVLEGTVRGWIFLRGFCLWSTGRRTGPMVFGRIAEKEGVSTIKIQAGSDLNFSIPMTIFVALGALSYVSDWIAGAQLSGDNRLFLLVGAMTAILLLITHFRRFEADHIVRFLIDKLSPTRVEGFPL